jgi:hypothetical protein
MKTMGTMKRETTEGDEHAEEERRGEYMYRTNNANKKEGKGEEDGTTMLSHVHFPCQDGLRTVLTRRAKKRKKG